MQSLRGILVRLGVGVMVLTWLCTVYGPHLAAAQTAVSVDCDAGQSISDALTAAMPGDTLFISGTCMEQVTITTDRLTLDGQGSTIIDGGGAAPANATEGAITIMGAQGVVLTGMTVQNGPDGIIGTQGAAFEVRAVTSQDNADEGLQVDESSTARLADCILQRNAGEGLNVLRTSSVTFFGTVVSQNNGGTGIAISNGSSAFVNTSLTPSGLTLQSINNGQNGFFVTGASSVSVTRMAMLLDNNGTTGLSISNMSRFSISSGSTLTVTNNNVGFSVGASSAVLTGTALTLENNILTGLSVGDVSRLLMGSESTLTIINNGGSGMVVFDTSHADLRTNRQVVIADNAGFGLSLNGGASADVFGPVEIRHNGLSNVRISENAHLSAGSLAITSADATNLGMELFNGHLRLSNSAITGHATDISASFGSRLELSNTVFNSLSCDATVLVANNAGVAVCTTEASAASAMGQLHIEKRRMVPQTAPVGY